MKEAPPVGAKSRPVTEIITAPTGAQKRRIRKLRVTIVDAPDLNDVGRVHTFAQDEVRIGSNPEADVPLADTSVSFEHLAIRLGPNGFTVTDTGSTNGSFAHAMRVERVTIAEEELLVRLGKTVVRLSPLSETVEQDISPRVHFGRMLGASAAIRETFALFERVASSNLSVLIEGETGTGKELAAEGIHDTSGRSGPLVAVNCGAIPKELIESELFGHAKGAFTGATSNRAGAFAAADQGTLFLDEVGELDLAVQAKLLRALERREVKPVGSDRARSVDIRVLSATNRALAKEVVAGRFRQDLYYRIAVVVVRIPPLRTRLEDLKLLVDAIESEVLRRRAASGQPKLPRLDETAFSMLARYDFPGNVRELRNIVERWMVLGRAPIGGEADEARPRTGGVAAPDAADLEALAKLPYHEARDAWVERFERSYAENALRNAGGNVSKAARDAGVDRRHIQRLMVRYGIKSSE